MSRYVLLAAAATIMHGVAFAQTPTAAAPVAAPAPPAIAAQGTPTTPPPPPSGRPSMPVPQAPAVAPTAPTPPTPPRAIAQSFPATPTNVRLELVLTDTYSGSPVKKTVSMLVVLGQNGMIRSSSRVGDTVVELNVDAMARFWPYSNMTTTPFARGVGGARGGRGASGQNTPTTQAMPAFSAGDDTNRPILLSLTLQYTPAVTGPNSPRPAGLNQSLSVIVQSGKPLLVSQSADPASDRKVTVEVTATVLK